MREQRNDPKRLNVLLPIREKIVKYLEEIEE